MQLKNIFIIQTNVNIFENVHFFTPYFKSSKIYVIQNY